ncbi:MULTISPECIES: ABC transporter ATP-binding protein [unclassified Aureimonas]|uniref:ABC transporter ATP-binding protein n=1 Tax=unclassified Aureimonas TaxID=2615206 RepID=UPI0006F75E91|nr:MULTISPECIES: ABC transporter ATP-binding protein [unclassified Aureimonas]KQT66165.1 multidrug ABC transporter ATP-binding protein [Aureimonas sp. Leaf427]KQT81073.1 multidrug ABC transporter ATP-binding protein [Aureimonas sp. Leaf460]
MIERFLQRFERTLDPFDDAIGDDARERERLTGHLSALPTTANGFIWHFSKQAKGPLLVLLVAGGVSGGVDALLFSGVGWIVDALERGTPDTLFAEHGTMLIGLALFTLIGRALVLVAASIVEEQVVAPSLFNRIRWQSYRRLMDQSYTFFQNDFAGRLAQKVQQIGQATGDFIVTTLQTLWGFVTFVLLAVTILGAIDWRMAAVLAVWSLGYAWIVRALLPRIRERGRERAAANSIWTGRVVDSFTNILSVKLFDATRAEDAFVKEGFRSYVETVWRLGRALTSVRSAVAILNGFMITGIGVVAILGWQAGSVTSGGVATALGLVLRLNQMSGWMMFNINGLVRNYGTIQDAVATITVTPTLVDRIDAVPLKATRGEVRFDDATFHYGKGGGVIDGLSLTIRAGEKVGLVGRSGAGKTTLVNLMLRLYDLEAGRISIDGQDIASVTQASLRAAIGVVTQDTSLLHRSIRENIAYGREDASEEAVELAARRANALGFIPGLRDPKGRTGFDAHVGERGIKLSGGQRQRIAIARVLLKDAPILVLDEATSALDSEVEAAIQENLKEMMKGKTVIAIAHRLSTIAALDRLIVLDGGRIVEEGRHADLVNRGGLYASLWARQSGGFIDAEAAE